MRSLVVLLFSGFLVSYAEEPVTPYDHYFKKSSLKYGINSKVLKAICYVETGLHPYAIGVSKDGRVIRSYYPKSLKEAKNILLELKALPGRVNFDVGLCQISRMEMEILNVSPEALLDPKSNIDFAAYVLKRKILKKGYTWEAVSSYNGGKNYHEKVFKVLRKWKVIE